MAMSEIIFIEQTDAGGRSVTAAGIFPIRHFLGGKNEPENVPILCFLTVRLAT